MRLSTHVRSESASDVGTSILAVARSRAVASGSSVSASNHTGDTMAEKAAQAMSNSRNQPNALAPTAPVCRVSLEPATPMMSSGTTNGITVIRTALIHAVPMTSRMLTNRVENADGSVSRASSIPTARPRTSPADTCTACDRSGLGRVGAIGGFVMRGD